MIRHVVMDMDGVLYRGEQVVPGALETLDSLGRQGGKVAFLTNNASMHRDDLVAKMVRLGLPCTVEQMWGSAYITARYLVKTAPQARVFLVGTQGMAREMQEAGLTVVPTHEGATHVVAGLDRTVTYEKLTHAHYAIRNGATFIATNLDPTYPDSLTTTSPGGGAIVAVLRTSTKVEPLVMGKPEITGISLIAEAWGVQPQTMATVGDCLDTDIACANNFGCLSVLVLTGITKREEAENARDVLKPAVILPDLNALLPLLENQS